MKGKALRYFHIVFVFCFFFLLIFFIVDIFNSPISEDSSEKIINQYKEKEYSAYSYEHTIGGITDGDELSEFFDDGKDYQVSSKIITADINKDGKRDFILKFGMGNCYTCWPIAIFDIDRATGNIKNLVDSVSEKDGFVVQDIVDLNSDGIKELKVLDERFEWAFGLVRGASPSSIRIFQWNGNQYVNNSSNFKEFYLERIKSREEYLQNKQDKCDGKEILLYHDDLQSIISLYLDYENAGLKEEGWQSVKKFLDCLKNNNEMFGYYDFIISSYKHLGTIIPNPRD